VSLYNPHSVVDDVLTFHLLHLKLNIDVKSVISACLNTSEHLAVFAKKSVARSRERGEGDLVRFVGRSIEESKTTFKHPFTVSPKFLIF